MKPISIIALLLAGIVGAKDNAGPPPPPFPNEEPLILPDRPSIADDSDRWPYAEPMHMHCGNYDSADKNNFWAMLKKWEWDYDRHIHDKTDVFVPARTCRRLGCWNTSGMYVCNDNRHNITLSWRYEVSRFAHGLSGCCRGSTSTSGDVVTDQRWKLVIGYANCNHHEDRDIPTRGGDNPNGQCQW